MSEIILSLRHIDSFGIIELDGRFHSRISRETLQQIKSSRNMIPPGITREQWITQRAAVFGIDMDVGNCKVLRDGSLRIRFDDFVENDIFFVRDLELAPEEFIGIPPLITVLPGILTGHDKIDSITNGIMTTR